MNFIIPFEVTWYILGLIAGIAVLWFGLNVLSDLYDAWVEESEKKR